MAEIIDFFAVIGFGTTIYFIGKILGEWKMNRLADESRRKLLEERSRERLEAEWKNMTTAGTPGGMIWPPTGEWVVLTKTSEGHYKAQTCGEPAD